MQKKLKFRTESQEKTIFSQSSTWNQLSQFFTALSTFVSFAYVLARPGDKNVCASEKARGKDSQNQKWQAWEWFIASVFENFSSHQFFYGAIDFSKIAFAKFKEIWNLT